MQSEFVGDPSPLTDADFERAARRLRTSVAAVRAIAEVESLDGGCLPDGRPKILFERHWFHRLTEGAWTASHPRISSPVPGGYSGGAREYARLEEAVALDRAAALRSASWGAFQIMGFNHRLAGYDDIEDFVGAMVADSSRQLDAFIAFIEASGLGDELRRQDWVGFARGYNGRSYRRNRYDEKLAAAHARFVAAGFDEAAPCRVLRKGARGRDVAFLQERLGIPADGIFGPVTLAQVRRFQQSRRLPADGVVGRRTWAALLVA